jgi:hypothetical protein
MRKALQSFSKAWRCVLKICTEYLQSSKSGIAPPERGAELTVRIDKSLKVGIMSLASLFYFEEQTYPTQS